MFSFVFRCFSVVFLALAVIFAILDGARSVGASEFVTKPLLDIWARGAPESLGDVETFATHYIGTTAWDRAFVPMLEQPGWLVFGVLALLFYLAGYRRKKPYGSFSAR
ncbi:hypothetical protein [Brucella thiophenivorans]|uniref:Uncharacterized protein n=1 Tax=Brucella thiophenivorans TaxID=571255 RepID=A0A256FZ59_9HYPH|nr:hypothetical protein [Brucella thiophenivorans]OYR20058.1 hypothetical protein CEV31_1481 [Brucella thiophenivorans]